MTRTLPPPSPSKALPRRRLLRAAPLLPLAWLAGCAAIPGREPVKVSLAGIEPLPGQGLELRLAVKLRLLNPNDAPIDYDGAFVELSVRGSEFASGASGDKGTVPRFGESILTIPVTVTAMAVVRQLIGLATGDRARVDYRLRGRLSGGLLGTVSFRDEGEVDLPALTQRALGSAPPPAAPPASASPPR
ncbi:MAG: LEA type 2 family protein [Ideonella sp.]|jgi:LEA14-like dessication related protein|nr:LEA type 2 family protein [Ideonella sp.]